MKVPRLIRTLNYKFAVNSNFENPLERARSNKPYCTFVLLCFVLFFFYFSFSVCCLLFYDELWHIIVNFNSLKVLDHQRS